MIFIIDVHNVTTLDILSKAMNKGLKDEAARFKSELKVLKDRSNTLSVRSYFGHCALTTSDYMCCRKRRVN